MTNCTMGKQMYRENYMKPEHQLTLHAGSRMQQDY